MVIVRGSRCPGDPIYLRAAESMESLGELDWLRTYKDKAELEAKNKEFHAAVAAVGVKLGGNVAKMEVREAESAFG